MDISVDLSKTVLETKRLLLRPWQERDAEDFYTYASVPGVGEMAGWRHHDSMETSRKILQGFMNDKNVFALEAKESGHVIGSLGLHYSWANEEPELAPLQVKEIGYVLSKAYWGQGLMPEAVKEVIRFCFEELHLEALTVGHFTMNLRSRRVIEKCGFCLVGHGTYYAKQLNKSFDEMKYIFCTDRKESERSC